MTLGFQGWQCRPISEWGFSDFPIVYVELLFRLIVEIIQVMKVDIGNYFNLFYEWLSQAKNC